MAQIAIRQSTTLDPDHVEISRKIDSLLAILKNALNIEAPRGDVVVEDGGIYLKVNAHGDSTMDVMDSLIKAAQETAEGVRGFDIVVRSKDTSETITV